VGTQVSVTASPSQGFQFCGWLSGAAPGGTANPLVVTIGTSPSLIQPQFAASCQTATTTTGVGNGGGAANCVASGTDAWVLAYIYNASSNRPVSGAVASVGGVGGGTFVTGADGYACISHIAVPGGSLLNQYTGTVTLTVTANGFKPQSVNVPVQGGRVSSATIGLVPNPPPLFSGVGSGVTTLLGFSLVAVGLFVAVRGKK